MCRREWEAGGEAGWVHLSTNYSSSQAALSPDKYPLPPLTLSGPLLLALAYYISLHLYPTHCHTFVNIKLSSNYSF